MGAVHDFKTQGEKVPSGKTKDHKRITLVRGSPAFNTGDTEGKGLLELQALNTCDIDMIVRLWKVTKGNIYWEIPPGGV